MLRSNLDTDTTEGRVDKLQLYLESPKEANLVKLANMLSPNNQYSQDQDALGIKIKKDEFKAKYNTTFLKKELHQECRKYNLALIRAKNYTGEYSMQFLEKLDEFFKEKGIARESGELQQSIYILAPAKSDTNYAEIKYPAQDPLMFFLVEQDYFILIDGSKEYISLKNWWQGLKHFNVLTCRGIYLVENYFILILLASLFTGHFPWALHYFFYLFGFVVAFLGMVIRMSLKKSKGLDAFEHESLYFNASKFPI